MIGEIAFVVSMVVKALSACLVPWNVFVDANAPTTQTQQPWLPFWFGVF
jgi:hypothetical protein